MKTINGIPFTKPPYQINPPDFNQTVFAVFFSSNFSVFPDASQPWFLNPQ